jgi:ABC-2 type transport system permease protein
MGRLGALVRKELRQFFRRKPLVVLVIWTIAIEIAICASSITYDVTNLPLAVQDLDGSPASRELTARFARTPYFRDRFRPLAPQELEALLESGRAAIGLVIPPEFSRQLSQRLPTSVQLLLDGSNSNAALIALGYATHIIGEYSGELEMAMLRRGLGEASTRLPAVRNQRRAWYNPTLRSLDFEVVSMLTLAVMMIAIILPAAGLAWEKEAGTIEQLLVMPFRPWELMLAKVLPTFMITLASLGLALWVPWWFEVPIQGNLVLFFALSALFLTSSLGLGLLLGTLAVNLQQALLLSFFTVFPVLVISGVLVPQESMPRAIQLLSVLSPLRYYHEIALGIFVKGVGIQVLWPQAVAMGGLGLGLFGLGLWGFGRQVR